MQRINLALSILAFGVILVSSCGGSTLTKRSSATPLTIEEIAKKELGNNPIIELNGTKTYALCLQRNENLTMTNYILIKASDRIITHRGQFRAGHAKWVGDNSVEILDWPGTIRGDQHASDFIKTIVLIEN